MATAPRNLLAQLRSGQYVDVLCSDAAQHLIQTFASNLLQDGAAAKHVQPSSADQNTAKHVSPTALEKLAVGRAALDAFLQTNVTGPVLYGVQRVEGLFGQASRSRTSQSSALTVLRKACLKSLDVDGVSVYPYIPNIELFGLARFIFSACFPDDSGARFELDDEWKEAGMTETLQWLVLRCHVWHYKLLTQPSLGPGSIFTKSSQWSDVPTLQQTIEQGLEEVEKQVLDDASAVWTTHHKVRFLLEKANVCIMLGHDGKAKEALQQATRLNGFVYALSGALGKRTRFQEKSTSQLVVLAKSGEAKASAAGVKGESQAELQAKPQALALNDDTLLENLEFAKDKPQHEGARLSDLPPALKDLSPDEQPRLSALDQIILLTEATLKDAFSPADTLTSEEILPFAVRVISDQSTNWQIYTQALLVRSRIEVHRSRTLERGVLQMQAVVDQVIVDTTAEPHAGETNPPNGTPHDTRVPAIQVSSTEDEHGISGRISGRPRSDKPTSFFPAAKPTDTAPAHVRLQYIHALSSPPRWHLESELAYAWASVGSLVSALEIFKRLRLWAEVALCFASNAANDDEDGRGSGGEAKAKAVLRWRLFCRTGSTGEQAGGEEPDEAVDVSDLREADYQGPERSPPPPNAPRLFCILGDIENSPSHYERAWEISNHRFSRAQRSLGEYYLQQKDLEQARGAYRKAVAVNRLSSEWWSRLGDITLRMGDFSEAAQAFGRAIACADNIVGGEDARTWSNLGSSLYSLYVERVQELKKEREDQEKFDDSGEPAAAVGRQDDDEDNGPTETSAQKSAQRDPATLLSQSLAAYKRGASIAHDNWRIWDNVITLASRLRPPAIPDILLALQNVMRIRNTEDAVEIEILRLLLNEAVLSQPKTDDTAAGVYDPPRGSHERAVCELLETSIVPLITTRSELWELVARERVWRRDYPGAVDAAEKAWRAAIGGAGAGGGLLPSSGTASADGSKRDWREDKEAWQAVVERTDDLVSMLENYGEEVPEIGAKWKGKARSAVRSVLGKAKENWEGSEEWERLQGLLEGLR